MTLLSLASKQIWPQVLAVAHLKPERVFLLHSEEPAESRGPAQRLKRFFDESGLVPKGGTRLELISDSDFDATETNGKTKSRWRQATENRNTSTLAHGVQPVGADGFEQMKQIATDFLGFDLARETNPLLPLDPQWLE